MQHLLRLRDMFGTEHFFVELQHHALPRDNRLPRRLHVLAEQHAVQCVATGNVHYALPEQSRLRDVLIATRHNLSLEEARRAGHLPLNSSYHLLPPDVMGKRFHWLPEAVGHSVEIAERCQVSLDFAGQRLPIFPAPEGDG